MILLINLLYLTLDYPVKLSKDSNYTTFSFQIQGQSNYIDLVKRLETNTPPLEVILKNSKTSQVVADWDYVEHKVLEDVDEYDWSLVIGICRYPSIRYNLQLKK